MARYKGRSSSKAAEQDFPHAGRLDFLAVRS